MMTASQPTRNTRLVASMIDPAHIAKPTNAKSGKIERIANDVQNSYTKRNASR